MTKGTKQLKIKRTQALDEKSLLKYLGRKTSKKEQSPHRLKRQSALVGEAFVEFWLRNSQPQIEPPSLRQKIESFSINFVTGEKSVTYANGQQEVTFVNQR